MIYFRKWGGIVLTASDFEQLSFRSSFQKSLRKIRMTDVDDHVTSMILSDLADYNEMIADDSKLQILSGVSYRFKSRDSVCLKLRRYKNTNRDLRGVLNDFLGIRIVVDDYSEMAGYDFLRKVDMREGKEFDDGYRGIHLYYQKDSLHYQIEVQVWSRHDALFNTWAHIKLYKSDPYNIGQAIRHAFDNGLLKDTNGFEQMLKRMREEQRYD